MTDQDVFVIGIDGGTESIRVGLFDLEGNLILARQKAYETQFPQSGWAEQEPEDWWAALRTAMAALLKDSGVAPEAIKGIGLDATCCTVVFLDEMMNDDLSTKNMLDELTKVQDSAFGENVMKDK